MDDFYKSINPYISILGFIITVFSILLAIYFYRKGKVFKEIGLHIKNFRLLHEQVHSLDKLSIKYDSKEIHNLTVSEIYLWNNGNTIIKSDDIVNLSPLKVTSKNGDILEAVISNVIEKSNNFKLDNISASQNLNFDYIEPSEGCILTIYHTGIATDIIGKVQGAKIKYYTEEPIKRKVSFLERNITLPMGILILISGTVLSFKKDPMGILFSLIGLLFIVGVYYNYKKKSPKIFSDIDSAFKTSSMYFKGE